MVADPRTSDASHAYLKYLLGKYSKKLDQMEALFESELRKASK